MKLMLRQRYQRLGRDTTWMGAAKVGLWPWILMGAIFLMGMLLVDSGELEADVQAVRRERQQFAAGRNRNPERRGEWQRQPTRVQSAPLRLQSRPSRNLETEEPLTAQSTGW